MTNLENYLFHQTMAERYARLEAQDIDLRTKGTLERMATEKNKYGVAGRNQRTCQQRTGSFQRPGKWYGYYQE